MSIRLIEIERDGRPTENLSLPEIASSVCASTAELYEKAGFTRPWICYLAEEGEVVTGACGFKSAPQDGRVEIAYFTFPGHERQGVATRMARELIRMARETEPGIVIIAHTLPEENASCAVLRKLGFQRAGMGHDDEVGEVWAWQA